MNNELAQIAARCLEVEKHNQKLFDENSDLKEINAAQQKRIDGLVKRLAELHPASAHPITVRVRVAK